MRELSEGESVEVYYDAGCPICTAAAGSLREHDAAGALRLLPTDDAPEGAPAASAMLRRIHVRADGRWLSGARALERALQELPGSGLVRLLIRLGLFLHVADPLYDLVARNRLHLGFLTGRQWSRR